MRYIKLCLLATMLLIMTARPTWAVGIGGPAPYWGIGSMEYYCVSHGGSPSDGYCYFPDGRYCDLKSFYNGTCPGREYYEQAMWMGEAYSFLHGDVGYNSPYVSSRGSGKSNYGYSYHYWPVYSNYWPFYPQESAQLTPIQTSMSNQSVAPQFNVGVDGGTGWVHGRILSLGGMPIAMAIIRVNGIRTSVTSDEQGYYKIALNSGLHRVDADRTGYAIPPRVVQVFSGQTSTLDLIGRETVVLGTRH
jgi:hypothetical protein